MITKLKKITLIGLPLVLVAGLLVVASQRSEDPAKDSTEKKNTTQTLKGLGLSPISFEEGDFKQFFSKASRGNDIVLWGGRWEHLGDESSAPSVLVALKESYKHTPVVVVDLSYEQLISENARKELKKMAVEFAEKNKPAYLGLGNEINFFYEDYPEEFEQRIAYYSEVYDAVKEVSPDTQIFTVFQLEHLRGMQGGLFGGENNTGDLALWGLLDKANKFDLIAFTTYPGLIYKHPDDIPKDYYTDIKKHTDKTIAFTETGWFRNGPSEEWESSVEEQERYIRKLPGLMSNSDPKFIVWLFLYDQETREPFTTMGLIPPGEATSKAWDAWQLIRL